MEPQSQEQALQKANNRFALCAITGLMVMAFVLYARTVNYEFIEWDDPWYVVNNELIHTWSFSNLYGIATQSVARNFAPLTIFSFLVDHTLWGLNPSGYHLSNVIIHAINSALCFLLIWRVTGRRRVAFFTAAIFCLHPMQVETVAWVSSRKGLLSASFMLGSLWYWLKANRNEADEMKGIGLFIAALLCKAIAVTIPGIVLVYDVIVLRKTWQQALTRQIIPLLLALWFIAATAAAQVTIVGGVRHHFGLPKWYLLMYDFYLLWQYAGMLLWPTNQSVLYDPQLTGQWLPITLSLVLWGGLCAYLLKYWRSHSYFTFALLVWLGLFVPVLNLFPLTTIMQDRYLYLPVIPFAAVCYCAVEMLVSALIREFWINDQRRQLWISGLACSLSLIYVGQLLQQTHAYLPVWQTDHQLWTHARQMTPDLPVVQIQYADACHLRGDKQAAVEALKSAWHSHKIDQPDRERILERLQEWNIPREQLEEASILSLNAVQKGC